MIAQYNQDKPRDQQIEQVAFEQHANGKQTLTMEGGEFSGNAFRCYAYLRLTETGELEDCFEVEGSKTPLMARLEGEQVCCQMPTIAREQTFSVLPLGYPFIRLTSIGYVLVEKWYDKPDQWLKAQAKRILIENNLVENKAVGVLFLKKEKSGFAMKPFVYFDKGGVWDLYKETACGSGSTAIGIYHYLQINQVVKSLRVCQPSGGVITVEVARDNGGFKAWIAGRVTVAYQGAFAFSS